MSVTSITDLGELRRLTHAPFSKSLVHAAAPRLELPAASANELRNWQGRLDRELYACGCTAGAIAMLGSLAALATVEFGLGMQLGSGAWLAAVWIAVALGAAVVGKGGGLVAARTRRRRLYAEIARTLTSRKHIASEANEGLKELRCADSASD